MAAGQQHTFEVRAVDAQGNKDPNPVTFIWTVLTPPQATQKIISTINSMNLPRGTTTSLEAPLNAALSQLNRNNDVAACNLLNAFLDQVNKSCNYNVEQSSIKSRITYRLRLTFVDNVFVIISFTILALAIALIPALYRLLLIVTITLC